MPVPAGRGEYAVAGYPVCVLQRWARVPVGVVPAAARAAGL